MGKGANQFYLEQCSTQRKAGNTEKVGWENGREPNENEKMLKKLGKKGTNRSKKKFILEFYFNLKRIIVYSEKIMV